MGASWGGAFSHTKEFFKTIFCLFTRWATELIEIFIYILYVDILYSRCKYAVCEGTKKPSVIYGTLSQKQFSYATEVWKSESNNTLWCDR